MANKNEWIFLNLKSHVKPQIVCLSQEPMHLELTWYRMCIQSTRTYCGFCISSHNGHKAPPTDIQLTHYQQGVPQLEKGDKIWSIGHSPKIGCIKKMTQKCCPLNIFFCQRSSHWGFWQFFSTGTYVRMGIMCRVWKCYEKYQEKKSFVRFSNPCIHCTQKESQCLGWVDSRKQVPIISTAN